MKKFTVLLASLIFPGCLAFTQQTPIPKTVTDINGNVYKTVSIGRQVWMAENLKATRYNNGTPLKEVKDNSEWVQTTTGAYCWHNNKRAYKSQYGALYNFYVIKEGNVCPTGWHVPTDQEWINLENYLISKRFNYDGSLTDNKIAKALASRNGWLTSTRPGAVGNKDYPRKRDATGFSARAADMRYSTDGRFGKIGTIAIFWTSTENPDYPGSVWYRVMNYNQVSIYRQPIEKGNGFSIRCLKDAPPDIKTGLVAYYPFNGNANDESGNHNNGIVHGATLTRDYAGCDANAYHFDGYNNYIEVPNNPYINFGKTTSFTVSLWISTTGNGTYGLIDKGVNDSVIYDISLVQRTPYYDFGTNNSIASLYRTTFPEGDETWHLVTATAERSTNTLRLYIDGKLDVELVLTSIQDFVMSSSESLKIGRDRNFYSPYSGDMDEIRIYNRALSETDVMGLYNARKPSVSHKNAGIMVINKPAGQQDENNAVDIYPNPANTILYFKNLKSAALITVFDLQGRKISSQLIENAQMNISDLSVGIYLLRIESGNQISVRKLLKQ